MTRPSRTTSRCPGPSATASWSAAASPVGDAEPLPWPKRHRKLVGGTLGTVFAAGLAAAVLAASGVLGGGDGAADKGATAAARPTATATATPAATAAPAQ